MATLRPVCTAFARRLCARQTNDSSSRSPILSLIQAYRASRPQCRSISHSPRLFAQVVDPPPTTNLQQQPKRTIRIGQLPGGRIDDATAHRLFGANVLVSDANNVLRILHHRRTTGSLADYGIDNLGAQFAHVRRSAVLRALEWLREKYPIDEARAAQEWAEREANRIQYELWLADPDTESKYKDPARVHREKLAKEAEEQAARDWESGEQRIGLLRVGKSQFERTIEERRRARLEEITKKAEEKEAKEKEMLAQLATGEWVRTPSGKQLMRPGESVYVDIWGQEKIDRRKQWAEYYQKKSHTPGETLEELLSKTTLAQRLVPMTVFVAAIFILSYLFAYYYTPPSPAYRLFPDLSLSTATVATLLGTQTLILICWRIRPLWPLMTKYLMHVPAYPRAFQAVGNIFTHVNFDHFWGNTIMMLVVGPLAHELVGRGVFMATWISGGALGTLFSLYWANLGRGAIAAHVVGASAANAAIVALFLLATDWESIVIPFTKMEFPFWPRGLLLGLLATEVLTTWRGRNKATTDHASHFGGYLVGCLVGGHVGGYYQRAMGWQVREVVRGEGKDGEGLEEKAGTKEGGLDVGAVLKQEAKEVGDAVGKAMGK